MPLVLSGTNGVTFPDSSLQTAAASPYVLKNRIINGDMRIDQRNAGSQITIVSAGFDVDRFQIFKDTVAGTLYAQQSTVAPSGFYNSMLLTANTAWTPATGDIALFQQKIEAFNTSDLSFGTASASTVTLSFWVRSSITGTYSAGLINAANNRSYVANYTVNSANTWEQKTITIAGDTSGTWISGTNSTGLRVNFDIGSGSTYNTTAGAWASGFFTRTSGSVNWTQTSGATFYITGVQLEVGTSATPFERRLYNQELANCQRYYTQSWGSGAFSAVGNAANGTASNGSNAVVAATFQVSMRAAPTVTLYDNTGASGKATQPFIANGLAATAGGIGVNGFKDVSGSGYTSNSAFFANYIASIEL